MMAKCPTNGPRRVCEVIQGATDAENRDLRLWYLLWIILFVGFLSVVTIVAILPDETPQVVVEDSRSVLVDIRWVADDYRSSSKVLQVRFREDPSRVWTNWQNVRIEEGVSNEQSNHEHR